MTGVLDMRLSLKKLCVTGLLACSMAVATSTTTFASEKPTPNEIEIAQFGGFYSGFTGQEHSNPYHIEVEPDLYYFYEEAYRVGTHVKDSPKHNKESIISLFEKVKKRS